MDEFLLTNRFGGYCSYSVNNGQTRKYHGLIVAGGENFARLVILKSINERIRIDGQSHNFSGNAYLGHEEPFQTGYLEKFHVLPLPTFSFRVGPVKVVKTLDFSEEENALTINYQFDSPEKFSFELEPLVSKRDFHSLKSIPLDSVKVSSQVGKQNISLNTYVLEITTSLNYTPKLELSYNHYYHLEKERGYEASEDLVIPALYSSEFPAGKSTVSVSFKAEPQAKSNAFRRLVNTTKNILRPVNNYSVLTDISRFEKLYSYSNANSQSEAPASIDPNFGEFLVTNARKFGIHDGNRYSIIAGYHWFGEWSRDTFISFKGLLLGLGRVHEAQRLLIDWSKYISVGLMPNTMQGLHYNSLDGILWYFVAVWHYYQYTEDESTVLHLLPKLERAVYALARGSKYGINIDAKGYLIWTDESKSLTWMDAQVDGRAASNRLGAAVEIQALWYNCLQILEHLSIQTDYKLVNLALLDQLEKLLEQNFEKDFWNAEAGHYADSLDLKGKQRLELRPNQLAIRGLPFFLGNLENYKQALEKVEQELLTPIGLRTLNRSHPDYCGDYAGDQAQRDRAYHQGTVWTWPLIFYYNGLLNSHNFDLDSMAKVKNHLNGSWEFIKESKLLTLPEIYTAESLLPTGAIAQAWSVAALIEGAMLITERQTGWQ